MSNQIYLVLDYESYSEADIKTVGAYEYSTHSSTEVLCAAWRLGTREQLSKAKTHSWSPMFGGDKDMLVAALLNPEIKVIAHNAYFEQCMTRNVMKIPNIPHDRWICTAARAASLALPRHLHGACLALGLTAQKDMDGHRLMLKMCKPRKPTKNDSSTRHTDEQDMLRLIDYCVADIAAEVELFLSTYDLCLPEQLIWALDQKINFRGMRIDVLLVKAALELIKEQTGRLNAETITLTEGKINSTTQRDAILKFVRGEGNELVDLTAKSVSDALVSGTLTPKSKRLLEIRQSVGTTSTAKYEAFNDRYNSFDHKVRDYLLYHNASTGRWTSQGAQIHNMPRGSVKVTEGTFDLVKSRDLESIELFYGDPMKVLSSCLRGVLIPTKDKKFVCGDFASIEVRVLFWMAGHDKGLNVYREKRDLYREMATAIYSVGLDQVTKDQREVGKRAILGAGYGMGPKKFAETCKHFGMAVTETLAEAAIKAYRETHSLIPQLWRDTESSSINAVLERGKTFTSGKCKWFYKNNFLWCELPSSRRLAFYQPEVRYEPTPWGEKRPKLYHWGSNPTTKQWELAATYGGKLVENIVQATARDVMAYSMMRVENNGFDVVISVHDELLTEASGDKTVEEFTKLMAQVPKWAQGLPIAVEAWESSHRYRKG